VAGAVGRRRGEPEPEPSAFAIGLITVRIIASIKACAAVLVAAARIPPAIVEL
jgi:hypothetical protein